MAQVYFPGAIPVPAKSPYPQMAPQGNMWSDVGQGLRQGAEDLGQFDQQVQEQKSREAKLQDMIEQRKHALAVQAAKEEWQQKELDFKQTEADEDTRRYTEESKDRDAARDLQKAQADWYMRRKDSTSSRGSTGPTEKTYEDVDTMIKENEEDTSKLDNLLETLYTSPKSPDESGLLTRTMKYISTLGFLPLAEKRKFLKEGVRNADELAAKIESLKERLAHDRDVLVNTKQAIIKKGVTGGEANNTSSSPTPGQSTGRIAEATRRARKAVDGYGTDPTVTKEMYEESLQLLKDLE